MWLTDRLTADWLDGRAYYRGRFLDTTIDNPDQRIQQDIDIFTAGVGGATNSPSVGTSLGNLRAGVSYPAMEGDIDDLTLRDTLAKVTLPNLIGRLDDTCRQSIRNVTA
ncbi:hypothetical protein MGAST_21330 [Mycobacterium gastri 'Wayne']|uniref:ABC transmembrane type-1 domain-containing protein n=1 Tax=Mycobacterium gastri TaxID=1777 RepID=A0A1X1VYB7_MYCGS|nr:hypothetical protein MGAST_21330 [Mycobacterium gastri 'Wayne']ORV75003.1 hypothetical protein AWC07_23890 [Mycobacterium gastri]